MDQFDQMVLSYFFLYSLSMNCRQIKELERKKREEKGRKRKKKQTNSYRIIPLWKKGIENQKEKEIEIDHRHNKL